MVTRLRIDLINKVLEVEGDEDFVQRIYDEFKVGVATDRVQGKARKRTAKKTQSKIQSGTKNQRKPKKDSLKILGELDLTGGGKGPSLTDFYKKYKANSHFDKIVLCVYYLQKTEGVSKVTASHVYTCYRKLKSNLPKYFSQALTDTKNQKAFITINSDGEISLTKQGVNRVEQEMGH